MTEDQLKAIPAFSELPIFDESDHNSDVLTRAVSGYDKVRECATLDEVLRCLTNSQLVPLGGLRAWVNGGSIVVAYFAERS